MSGHNPHSHLSQPNSSWNPLQIPSYIPRQPQLAHMSNERPLVRSPLTWHSPAPPTPPDAFYSFLSANHKSLELNPLLPSFVRGPPPFGSVDLTIQTARNSTTPSPRNLTSPPPSHPDFAAHNKPQQQPFPPQHHPHHQAHQQQIPRCITPNNLNSCNIPSSTGTGVIQSTGSVRDKFQCSTSNGSNNGELAQVTPTPGSIFIRDARQINSDLAKMVSRDSSAMELAQLHMNEPVELIKEHPYQTTKSHSAAPSSPKRLSPTRPPSIPNSTPLSPSPRSPLTTLSNTGSVTDLVNNHIMKASGNVIPLHASQKPEPIAPPATASMSSENSPLPLALPPSPTTTTTSTSNEDSVDSQTSKSRRKRKPNKTTRVSNDSDESMQERDSETSSLKRVRTPNEQADINPIPEKNETLIDLDTNKLISSNRNEIVDMTNSANTTCQSDTQENREPISFVTGEMQTEQAVKDAPPIIPAERDLPEANNCESAPAETAPPIALELCQPAPTPVPDEPHSVIVNNTSVNLGNRNESKSPTDSDHSSNTNIMDTCQTVPTSEISVPSLEIDRPSSAVEENTVANPPVQLVSAEPSLDSPRRRIKRKGDSDDIETIDKIAAMIASTQSSEEPNETVMTNDDNLDVLSEEIDEQKGKHADNEVEAQFNTSEPETISKISDLTEILGTPPSGSSPSKDLLDSSATNDDQQQVKLNVVEKCFEEVENKLEEMFAGIEDGEPPPCILPAPTIDAPITPEVISELGLGGIGSPQKQIPADSTPLVEETTLKTDQQDKDDTSLKSSSHHNSTQKRSHNSNNKVESTTPPNKKRKVSKKSTQSSSSSSNQKPSTSASTKSSKSHSSSTAASHSSKSSKSAEKQSSLSSTTKDTKVKEEPATVEYKGPFIHLKSDGTINVINAPTTEDIVEKQKVKKSIHSHSHSDRNKIRGLHVSTLSTKYDADTTDTTWMCVFCKRGPHKVGLGDLFGPYIVTTTCEGFAYSQKDPNDDEFVSKRTKAEMFQKHVNGMPVVPAATSSLALATSAMLNTSSSSPTMGKKKRKNNDSPSVLQNPTPSTSSSFDIDDVYVGMTKVSDTSYEVWVHEDCVVWSSGVYIIGSRIVGLDTAVWSSTRYKCSICSKNGAMISCLQRGCLEKAHISCARLDNWDVNESEFKSTCAKHPTTALDTTS